MPIPFQCPNCLNWHVRIPTEFGCYQCETSSHTLHTKTGLPEDCHWGMMSATKSEVALATALAEANTALDYAREGRKTEAEGVLLTIAASETQIAEWLRWAGVFEMPGMQGERNDRRYKGIEALEDLVEMTRRPKTDLDAMRRSIRNTAECERDRQAALAEARQLLVASPVGVSPTPAPVEVAAPQAITKKIDNRTPEQVQATQDRMARVRAARKSKQAVSTA